MRLRLEFVPRRPSRWRWLPAAVTLCAAAVLFAQYENERTALEAKAAALDESKKQWRRAQSAREAAERGGPEQARRRADREALAGRLSYPWHRVLATLEQANVQDVAVLSMSHGQETTAELIIEAHDALAINEFVAELNGDDGRKPAWYLAALQPQPQSAVPTIRGTVRQLSGKR